MSEEEKPTTTEAPKEEESTAEFAPVVSLPRGLPNFI